MNTVSYLCRQFLPFAFATTPSSVSDTLFTSYAVPLPQQPVAKHASMGACLVTDARHRSSSGSLHRVAGHCRNAPQFTGVGIHRGRRSRGSSADAALASVSPNVNELVPTHACVGIHRYNRYSYGKRGGIHRSQTPAARTNKEGRRNFRHAVAAHNEHVQVQLAREPRTIHGSLKAEHQQSALKVPLASHQSQWYRAAPRHSNYQAEKIRAVMKRHQERGL